MKINHVRRKRCEKCQTPKSVTRSGAAQRLRAQRARRRQLPKPTLLPANTRQSAPLQGAIVRHAANIHHSSLFIGTSPAESRLQPNLYNSMQAQVQLTSPVLQAASALQSTANPISPLPLSAFTGSSTLTSTSFPTTVPGPLFTAISQPLTGSHFQEAPILEDKTLREELDRAIDHALDDD